MKHHKTLWIVMFLFLISGAYAFGTPEFLTHGKTLPQSDFVWGDGIIYQPNDQQVLQQVSIIPTSNEVNLVLIYDLTWGIRIGNATLVNSNATFSNLTLNKSDEYCIAPLKDNEATAYNDKKNDTLGNFYAFSTGNFTGRCYLDGSGGSWVASHAATVHNVMGIIVANLTGGGTPSPNFTITAKNIRTNALLLDFNASVDGKLYKSNSTGAIVTHLLSNASSLYPVYVNGTLANASYYPFVFLMWNVSNNMIANMTPFSIEFIYQNPANNTQYNHSSIEFNLSSRYNGTPTITSCTLNLNSVTSDITYDWGSTNGTLTLIGTFLTVTEGMKTYNWTCNNSFVSYTSNNSIFYVDTIYPTILTNFQNNSIYYSSNMTAYINFTDETTLFSTNITIDSTLIYNKYLNGTTNNDSYSLNLNPQSFGLGTHTLKLYVADGHTANSIGTYDVSTGIFGDIIQFKDKNKAIKIEATDKTLSDRWSATKRTDSYTFKYIPGVKSTTKTFSIECDEDLYIMDNPNTPYKKWFVCGDKWIDFKITGENNQISIERKNKKKAEIILSGIKNINELNFESIGELNKYSIFYTFYVINATESHYPTLTETAINTFDLNLTSNISSAYLIFNGITHTATKTIEGAYSNYQVSFTQPLVSSKITNESGYWFFNVSGASPFNISVNQSIYQMEIYNCTTGNHGINYSAYDETSLGKIPINISGTYTIWLTDKTLSRSNTLTISNVQNFSLCIDLNDTLNIDYGFEYSSDGYITRHKSILNGYINKTTQFVDLYLLVSTYSSFVANLINQVYSPLTGYEVDFLMYHYSTGNYTSVQSEISDYLGNSVFSYNPTTKYRWNIYNQSGIMIYDSGDTGTYIVSNPTTIRIGATADEYISTITTLTGVKGSLIFYNLTKILNFTWTDKTGYTNDFCLKVIHNNDLNTTMVLNECSSALTGSITYNSSGMTGSFLATPYAKGSTYVLLNPLGWTMDTLEYLWQVLGTDAYLWQAILTSILALAFAYINPSLVFVGIDASLIVGIIITLIPLGYVSLIGIIVVSIAAIVSLRT